jgi:hypothetical protein
MPEESNISHMQKYLFKWLQISHQKPGGRKLEQHGVGGSHKKYYTQFHRKLPSEMK